MIYWVFYVYRRGHDIYIYIYMYMCICKSLNEVYYPFIIIRGEPHDTCNTNQLLSGCITIVMGPPYPNFWWFTVHPPKSFKNHPTMVIAKKKMNKH
jgi:hypothetical protein